MAASDPDCSKPNPKDNNRDCGTHNMMIVGQEAIFLSHLPMFASEHRFQVIVEATLKKEGNSVDDAYFNDRKQHQKEKMYTLNPSDVFVLSRIFGGAEARSGFGAGVFRGHLERGGELIPGLDKVQAEVKRVVYAAELPTKAGPPKNLTYILFGKGEDLYLAHQIVRAPDFDQIIAVRVSGQQFAPDDLMRGIIVTIPNRPNSATKKLKPAESVEARAQVSGANQSAPLRLTAGTEFYFEESELKVPPNFGQTALEKAAGFK